MNLVKEGLLAVLVATWTVGLVSQFGSWTMTAFYIAISLVMITMTFGNRLMFRLAPRRSRRR
jgi:nitrate/nitrite transporter NarK